MSDDKPCTLRGAAPLWSAYTLRFYQEVHGHSPAVGVLQEARDENASRTEELPSLGKSIKPPKA